MADYLRRRRALLQSKTNFNKGVGSNPTAVTSFVRMPEINFEFSEINDVFLIDPEQFKGEIINQD